MSAGDVRRMLNRWLIDFDMLLICLLHLRGDVQLPAG